MKNMLAIGIVKWCYNSSVRVIGIIILSHKSTQEEHNGLCHLQKLPRWETFSILVAIGSGLLPFPNEGPRHEILSKERPTFPTNRCLLEDICSKSHCFPGSSQECPHGFWACSWDETRCLEKLGISKENYIIMIRAKEDLTILLIVILLVPPITTNTFGALNHVPGIV